MQISGKIIYVLPERSGVSQRSGSEWRCASYVIETMEQYPKKCNFEVFGAERIQQFAIQVGQLLTVDFDIDAHEYNGRWFNSLRAWRVAPYDPNAIQAPVMDAATGFAPGTQPTPMPGQPVPAAAPAFTSAGQQPAAPAPSASAQAAPAPGGDVFGESTDDLPF